MVRSIHPGVTSGTVRFVQTCRWFSVACLCLAASAKAAEEQQLFASPEEAVRALTEAVKAKDKAALNRIFGPVARDLLSGEEAQDAADFELFSKALAERTNLVKEEPSCCALHVGGENWPFPIPLVQQGDRWRFDVDAGKEEILNRCVGENELHAIAVCCAYGDAQREYALDDRNADDVLEYALKFTSEPEKRDGLFWETGPGEELSPLGSLVAQACHEEFRRGSPSSGDRPQPFHGYFYKILTRQGANAPGGKYDYVINAHMVGGFALVAYPADWGKSGVMTFLVNQRGKVLQKDLGEKTADIVKQMTEYNPDETWTVAKD